MSASVDIKDNFTTTVAFRVADAAASKILRAESAEKLTEPCQAYFVNQGKQTLVKTPLAKSTRKKEKVGIPVRKTGIHPTSHPDIGRQVDPNTPGAMYFSYAEIKKTWC